MEPNYNKKILNLTSKIPKEYKDLKRAKFKTIRKGSTSKTKIEILYEYVKLLFLNPIIAPK